MLSADAAYDAEAHHAVCYEEWGIAQVLIPINHRGHPETEPSTPYRRAMFHAPPEATYGQRWQIESLFSRFKRRLGSALTAHSAFGRHVEIIYRILTHNLAILLVYFFAPAGTAEVSTEHFSPFTCLPPADPAGEPAAL